ncbi:MAG: glycosyltransferase family A protein [Candidatus Magasanikbacteria bacterium]
MRPLISVIIPVYNQVDKFKLALLSIENQTYKNIEIIVIDDGSEEEIQNSKFKISKDIPLHLYRQENKGAPAARNKGFELSKGEYVIFWDADIIAYPEMLEKMYLALQQESQVSYAYSDFYFGKKKMKAGGFDGERLKKNNYITTASLIHREDVVPFDENLKRFQDWDLWLTMLEQGKKGVHVPEFLFTIIPGGTMSSWLPSFAYKKPWRWIPGIEKKVEKYEEAKGVVQKKHHLKTSA